MDDELVEHLPKDDVISFMQSSLKIKYKEDLYDEYVEEIERICHDDDDPNEELIRNLLVKFDFKVKDSLRVGNCFYGTKDWLDNIMDISELTDEEIKKIKLSGEELFKLLKKGNFYSFFKNDFLKIIGYKLHKLGVKVENVEDFIGGE